MSIWLIGNRGMLGTEVEKLLQDSGRPYRASDLEVDITNKRSLQDFALNHGRSGDKIDWIINCSGYTAVDRAEDEADLAFRINSRGVQNIAKTAASLKAGLVHISTDYVFNGKKDSAYLETDETVPTGVYGASKLEGDRCVKETLEKFYILRTAWLYGRNGTNFVLTMLKLFGEREEIQVVSDQWGSPTYAVDLAGVILGIVERSTASYGTYHFTNEGRTNWYEFTKEIYRLTLSRGLIKKEVKIEPIGTEQYPTRAKRPRNSYLSKEKIKQNLGITIRSWKEALKDFIDGLETKR